jgi:hypothetical protein
MRSDCCARATSGQLAAAPPTSVINSRRLVDAPRIDNGTLAYGCGCCAAQGLTLALYGMLHAPQLIRGSDGRFSDPRTTFPLMLGRCLVAG